MGQLHSIVEHEVETALIVGVQMGRGQTAAMVSDYLDELALLERLQHLATDGSSRTSHSHHEGLRVRHHPELAALSRSVASGLVASESGSSVHHPRGLIRPAPARTTLSPPEIARSSYPTHL